MRRSIKLPSASTACFDLLPTLRNSLSLKQVLALYGNKSNHKRSLIDAEGNSILLLSYWCHPLSRSLVAALCREDKKVASAKYINSVISSECERSQNSHYQPVFNIALSSPDTPNQKAIQPPLQDRYSSNRSPAYNQDYGLYKRATSLPPKQPAVSHRRPKIAASRRL